MKVTIHDVAAKAGVSIKTVSRVMNNEPSVKQATIDKVNQAMQELHYQPNAAARNLASTKSYSIGYIYDNPNAYYVIDMQRGLLDACRKHGYELLIHPTNAKSPGSVQEVLDLITRELAPHYYNQAILDVQAHLKDRFESIESDLWALEKGS